jgi:hypothetical protein
LISQARGLASLFRDKKRLPHAGRRQLSAASPITHHDRATYVNDFACEEFEVLHTHPFQVQVSNAYQYFPPSFGLPNLGITSDNALWYLLQSWIDDTVIEPASPWTAFSVAGANDSFGGGGREYPVHGLPALHATCNIETYTVAENASVSNGWPNIQFTTFKRDRNRHRAAKHPQATTTRRISVS